MVTIQEMVEAITTRAEGRYERSGAEADLFALSSNDFDSEICRLKRFNADAGWRTILIAALPFETSSIQAAFRWAANVRDVLPEPQTADLYMFMLITGIPLEDAARIESDDRFCRKMVAQELEKATDFLDRTFLATLSPVGSSDTISDPLLAALASLANAQPWTTGHLTDWRESLLSGKNGSEVAQALNAAAFGSEASQ